MFINLYREVREIVSSGVPEEQVRKRDLVYAAYLIHRYGIGWRDAVSRASRPLDRDEVALLRAYSIALASAGERVLDAAVELGDRYEWGYDEGHASVVTQLSLRLWEEMTTHLGLPLSSARVLTIASLLHDIGRYVQDKGHAAIGASIVAESPRLTQDLSGDELRAVTCLIRHHGRKTDPRADSACPRSREVHLLAAILKIGDGLDYARNREVIDVEVKMGPRTIVIGAVCEEPCGNSINIERASEKKWLLEQLLRKPVIIEPIEDRR